MDKRIQIYNYNFVVIKGIEDENEKESTENAVLCLRKKFSQDIQSRETFNQPRRRASETTINTVNQLNIPSLTEKETKTTLKGESLIENIIVQLIISVDRTDKLPGSM